MSIFTIFNKKSAAKETSEEKAFAELNAAELAELLSNALLFSKLAEQAKSKNNEESQAAKEKIEVLKIRQQEIIDQNTERYNKFIMEATLPYVKMIERNKKITAQLNKIVDAMQKYIPGAAWMYKRHQRLHGR